MTIQINSNLYNTILITFNKYYLVIIEFITLGPINEYYVIRSLTQTNNFITNFFLNIFNIQFYYVGFI